MSRERCPWESPSFREGSSQGELIPGLIGHNIDSHTITNTRTAHLYLLRDRKFHAV